MSFTSRASEDGVVVTYDVGFTVLSIFTSVAGCITTLELLHRRTSTKGLFNWFLFIGACVAMGGCGIWSMHFIANRAIILEGDAPEKQIQYSPGFTALSAFLPILVLSAAFYFLGSNRSKARPLYLVLSGVLTGTAVCGMHYVGNAGIQNYSCRYKPANIAGSAVIAVMASLVALSVFFRLRETWTDSWWKRALCALVLASAVCGMHWTAAVGTSYIEGETNGTHGGTTRVQTVIVCAVLSLGCCLVLLMVALIRGRKIRLTKTRAQQVVLACAYFDETGRIMVTQECAFPCQKITNRYIEKTFGEDELSRSHPTFMWIFRASRNWSSVKDLVPNMIRNLDIDPQARAYRPGSQSPTSDASSEVGVNFSTVFKQLFCVAASQLSQSVHEPFENLGELFEDALDTGTTHLLKANRSRKGSTTLDGEKAAAAADLEADAFSLGRGKYLFLNRQLTKNTADRYAAMGYRFASIGQVSDLLSKNMEVKPEKMHARLERMKASVTSDCLPPPGVHLAFFMVRPSVHKSFDVLVPSMLQNQLPTQPLKLFLLTDWHRQFLRRYDEWAVCDILSALVRESGETAGERDFAFTLHSAILQLIDQVGELETMVHAVFSARAVELSLPWKDDDGVVGLGGGPGDAMMTDKCTLLTIRIMNDIHAKPRSGMAYVPLSFFGAQQVVQAGGKRERERWERRVRMEFGAGDVRKQSVGTGSGLQSPLGSPWGFWAGEGRGGSAGRRGSVSVKSLRMWPSSWLKVGSSGSHGGAGGGGGGRESGESEDEARIVKTVEVSLKEEKEDGCCGGDENSMDGGCSRDVSRVLSHGVERSVSCGGLGHGLGHGQEGSGGGGREMEEIAPGMGMGMGGRRGAYTAGCHGGWGCSLLAPIVMGGGRGVRCTVVLVGWRWSSWRLRRRGMVAGLVRCLVCSACEMGDGGRGRWVGCGDTVCHCGVYLRSP